tara:strand:- start:154 stop:426 length:273 start_codon:yes stop_codon:yes gene_type:complete
MTWSSNVGKGNEKFYFNEMIKELATKRLKKTKLKVCLQYLKIANYFKRRYSKSCKLVNYPDSNEYFKLAERKRKYAKQIIFVVKNIRKKA